MDNFAWAHQLQCPPTVCSDSVKKRLCRGVLEFLWEDISSFAFPVTEVHKIRKNILLHKLRHGLNDSRIESVKNLSRLRPNSDTLKHEIIMIEEEYENQDHTVRQKMQELKDIKTTCSIITMRKDIIKLKHSETSKQLKDCNDMRQVCQYLMPNTSKEMHQERLRENLDIVTGLRSGTDKKQIWKKISNSLGDIDIYTLWTQLYQALSQDLDILMKLETKNNFHSTEVGENIDIGLARAYGQYIYMISKRVLSKIKIDKYQQYLLEFIELIESSYHEDISTWLSLTLEVKKLETEQACLQNEVQKLKDNIQDNSLLNFNISQLTIVIETIDEQMDGYVKDIQKSIAILNSTASLICRAKEKLHYELQKIAALHVDNYDPKYLNNSLDIELDIFYNILDLNALRKIMLKGDVGLYRHAICCFDKAAIATINPQYLKIRSYFPMIHAPIYSLIECYKNVMANIIYTKLQYSAPTDDVECTVKSVLSRDKYDHVCVELLNISKIVCDQTREEMERFNVILNSWINQDVQEAMILDETTVDNVPFKDWLKRYNLLLYMIQTAK